MTPSAGGAGATLHQRNPRGDPQRVQASVVTRQMENKTEKTTTIERHGGSEESDQ